MPLVELPDSAKKDFHVRHLEELCGNDYVGIDHGEMNAPSLPGSLKPRRAAMQRS